MPISSITNGLSSATARSRINEAITAVNGLGDAASKNVGTTAGSVAAGDDSRLSDARTPTSHTHDDRYYTESEVNALLTGKADASHSHAAYQITTPRIYHVATNGNDTTGDGSPAKPFATGNAALAAGIAGATGTVGFAISFGAGAFSITFDAANYNGGATPNCGNLRRVVGAGIELTTLDIEADGASVTGEGNTATSGYAIQLEVLDLALNYSSNGGTGGDGANGGHGGSVVLRGSNYHVLSGEAKGRNDGATPGDGGFVSHVGGITDAVDVSSATSNGTIRLYQSDLRNVSLTGTISIEVGGCICASSIPGTDKGGNIIV